MRRDERDEERDEGQPPDSGQQTPARHSPTRFSRSPMRPWISGQAPADVVPGIAPIGIPTP